LFEPKLGVSLATISSDLNAELFDALADSTIATVEISASLFDGEEGTANVAVLNEGLARAGIEPASVHALFGGMYDISAIEDEAHRRAVEYGLSAIDLSVDLSAPLVIVHASAEPIEEYERSARFAQARRGLEALGDHAAANDRQLALELLPRTCLGNTTDELLELLAELSPDVFGICLDTNHLMDRHQSLPDEIRRLNNRLIATHLSDYDGIDEKHELPGQGVLDWPAAMTALRDIDYQGPLNYECKPGGYTPRERIVSLQDNFAWLAGL